MRRGARERCKAFVMIGRSLAVFAVCLLWTGSACADAIDGNWCRQGESFTIEANAIITPGGRRTVGDYRRHTFSYVVPAPDAGAGNTIEMVLVHDNLVHLLERSGASGAPTGPVENWRRCRAISMTIERRRALI